MKCEDCIEKLSFLVFDELGEAESLLMHEHLAECDACRDEHIELMTVGDALDSSVNVKPQDLSLGVDRLSRIMQEIDESPERTVNNRSRKPSTIKQFPILISTLAACIAIAFLWFGTGEKREVAKSSANNEISVQDIAPVEEVMADEVTEAEESFKRTAEAEGAELSDAAFEDKKVLKKQASSKMKMNRDFKSVKKEDIKESIAAKDVLQKADDSDSAGIASVVRRKAISAAPAVELKGNEKEAKKLILGKNESVNEVDRFKAQLRTWLTENEKDSNISSVVNFLLGLKSGDFSLKEALEKGERVIKVYLLNKNQKPIEYGSFFLHNGKVVRFKSIKGNK